MLAVVFDQGALGVGRLLAEAAVSGQRGLVEGRADVLLSLEEAVASVADNDLNREASGELVFRHHEARSMWVTTDAAGEATEHGEDWLEFGEDGLLSRIHVLADSAVEVPTGAALVSWQRAWNTRDTRERTDALLGAPRYPRDSCGS